MQAGRTGIKSFVLLWVMSCGLFAQTFEAASVPRLTERSRISYTKVGPKRVLFYSTSMLKLTKKADYGLISPTAPGHGARGEAASAKDISEAYRIPLPLLSQVLQKLVKAGLLNSEQGTNGGYQAGAQRARYQRPRSHPHPRRPHHLDPMLHRTRRADSVRSKLAVPRPRTPAQGA